MADTVAQIKSRLNISDVVGGYLKLQKSGANFKARCPFHNEKTPSFHINTERQIWHCFGCNKGGDLISFVQDIEGIEFLEALRILGPRAGVPIERIDARPSGERSRRATLLKATSLAQAFFTKQLQASNVGKRALQYLRDRGFTDATIEAWGLGWAPNDWQALHTYLAGKGFAPKDLTASGLVSERGGRLYDRFRGRIMFPIRDHNGQAVGFTGRIFGRPEDQEAKYINTPQTALYDKSRILFGLDQAKMAIREADTCVLVEGNTDAMMSWQAGVQNVVATSGTALTADQLRILARYGRNLHFCFDADSAGAVATRRGIALAMAANLNVRIATLDDADCKDPADYVLKHGADRWRTVSGSATHAVQYYLDQSLQGFDASSTDAKRAVLTAVGPFVKRLTSKVEVAHWVSQLATILRASADDVRVDLAALKDDLATELPERTVTKEPEPVSPEAATPDPLEQALVALLVKDLPRFHGELTRLDPVWLSERTASLVADLRSADPASFSWDAFIKEHDDGTWHLEFARMRADELFQDIEESELQRQWQLVLARLGQRFLSDRARRMELDIRDAEEKQDTSKLSALLADFSRIKQDIAQLFRS